jgi:hypothetical protein
LMIPQPVLDTVPEYSKAVMKGAGSSLTWPALLRRLDKLDTTYRG